MRCSKHLFLQVLLVFVSANLYAGAPPLFDEYRINAEVKTRYFNTTSNFNENGTSQSLFGSQSYTHIANDFKGEYIIGSSWLVGGSTQLVYAESSGLFVDKDNTVFDHFTAHTAYRFNVFGFNLIPFSELTVTLNSISEDTTEVLTGEGVNALEIGGWASYEISMFEPYGYFGLKFQDDERADLILWAAGARAKVESFFVSGQMGGYFPFSDDGFKNTPFRRNNVTNNVNAGSRMFYAVNPEAMEVEAEGGYRHVGTGIQISAGVSHILSGKNVAEGTAFWGRLSWGLQPMDKAARPGKEPTREDRFRPILEEYEGELFDY